MPCHVGLNAVGLYSIILSASDHDQFSVQMLDPNSTTLRKWLISLALSVATTAIIFFVLPTQVHSWRFALVTCACVFAIVWWHLAQTVYMRIARTALLLWGASRWGAELTLLATGDVGTFLYNFSSSNTEFFDISITCVVVLAMLFHFFSSGDATQVLKSLENRRQSKATQSSTANSGTQINIGQINTDGGSVTFNNNDLKTSAVRGPSRDVLLDEMSRASRARCASRWQKVGLSQSTAELFADNPAIGAPPQDLQDAVGKSLVFLVDEHGAGKTLTGERVYQMAIIKAKSDAKARIPIYLSAKDINKDLRSAVNDEAIKLGNPSESGIFLVVDGIDETNAKQMRSIIDGSRELMHLWTNSAGLVTSRPSVLLKFSQDCRSMALLDDASIEALVSEVSGFQNRGLFIKSRLPQSVQKAIRLPLYAILLGIYLRERGKEIPNSTAALLSHLVDIKLARPNEGIVRAQELLIDFAIKSIDRSGSIPQSEAGTTDEVRMLCDTNLVMRRSGSLEFSLPIYSEWFAAQALAAGKVRAEDLLNDEIRLERWRLPLTIAIGTENDDCVAGILSPIAQYNPGLAGVLVNDAIDRWNVRKDVAIPSAIECGRRIRRAMQAFVDGMGDLSALVAPVTTSGHLAKVGVRVKEGMVLVAWGSSDQVNPEVVALPESFHFMSQGDGWCTTTQAPPANESAWAWQWVRSHIAVRLSESVRYRKLRMTSGPVALEQAWSQACMYTSRSSGSHEPIPLDEIESRLHRHYEFVEHVKRTSPNNANVTVGVPGNVDVDLLRVVCSSLRGRSLDCLSQIHPVPDIDQRSPYVWERYSTEQLIARVQSVYETALIAYEQIVATWLRGFRRRMNTAATLPAILQIRIELRPEAEPLTSLKFLYHAL